MSLKMDMLERLTSVYFKDPNSNLGKFIEVISKEIEEIRHAYSDIKIIRDIDLAYGINLDRAGENVQQQRGQLNDEKYRILIKGRIARNRSSGSIPKIIEVLATMLNIELSEIEISEKPDGEMASIYISVPLKPIGEAGLSRDHFIAIVNRICGGGVRPYSRLRGTFEFSDLATIYDPTSGFSDTNNPDTGGYFGSWHDVSNPDQLPDW